MIVLVILFITLGIIALAAIEASVSGMSFQFSLILYAIGFVLFVIGVFIIKSKGKNETVSTVKSGRDYEFYCANRLRKEGFRHVGVTPASGDFGADIIAYDKNGFKVCFQCKYFRGSVGISAVQEVLAAKSYYNCQAAGVLTNSTFTKAAVKLAKSANVALIEHFYDDDLSWIDRIEEFDAMID